MADYKIPIDTFIRETFECMASVCAIFFWCSTLIPEPPDAYPAEQHRPSDHGREHFTYYSTE